MDYKCLAWMVLALLPLGAAGQTARRDSLRERVRARVMAVDSALAARSSRVSYDTAFISRPAGRLTLKVRSNVSGSAFRVRGTAAEAQVRSHVSTDVKATLSLGVTYRGISAGVALNPGKLFGRYSDYELNVNAYANRYGADVAFQKSATLSGSVGVGDGDFCLRRGMMDMRMLSVNAYYAFSGRRFSYPAAFSQSCVQRRSAGSWLAGLSLLGGSLHAGAERPERMPDFRIYVGHLGLGGGYGYNLVAGRWLFHASALPTVAVSNLSRVEVDGVRRRTGTRFPDVILAERAAAVCSFGQKWFAGGTLVMTHSLTGSRDLTVGYRKWRTRLFVGRRL